MTNFKPARYWILLFNLFFYAGYSQNTAVDSLNRILKNAKHDTTRIKTLSLLGESFFGSIPDSAIYFWNKACEICKLNEQKKKDQETQRVFDFWQSQLYDNTGCYYQAIGEPDKSLSAFLQAVVFAEKAKDSLGVARSRSSIGEVYFRKGDIGQSLDFYLKALKYFEKKEHDANYGLCLMRIGLVYSAQGEIVSALTYLQKAQAVFEKMNALGSVARIMHEIGAVYSTKGDPFCKGSVEDCEAKSQAKALELFFKVLAIHEKLQNTNGISSALNFIGRIYEQTNEPEKALPYIQRALAINEKINFKIGILSCLDGLGAIMLAKGDLNQALGYANRCMSLAKELNLPAGFIASASLLKRIYVKQHKYKEALEMQELYTKMRDSTNNEKTRKSIVKKQIQFEYEKKSQRDSILNITKIEEARFKNEEAVARQRSYTYGGLIAFALMLLVAIVSLRAYRNKQKANVIITEQKQLADAQRQQIEIANKDLERQHLLNQKIFSVISHDFRGPMLSMSFLLDEFREQNNHGALNSAVANMSSQLNNANDILNNLLNWARTEINIKDFDKSVTTLADTSIEVIKEFDLKLTAKKVSVESNIPANSQLAMPPDIFRIALRNLISNAIKFSYPETKITIVFDEKAGRLTVTDTGTGITAEKLQTLFRKQVNPGLGTGHEEGFGIGLYIVSELLYKYGYTISVQSEVGKGSSFHMERLAVVV